MEEDRKNIINWLHKASKDLLIEEELLFPADSKADQKEKRRMFISELRIFNKIDPISGSELQISKKFRDHRFWVVVKKIAFSPLIAFKRNIEGIVERVVIEDDAEKFRRLNLMKEDGYTLTDIEEMEGSLTEEEVKFLKDRRYYAKRKKAKEVQEESSCT